MVGIIDLLNFILNAYFMAYNYCFENNNYSFSVYIIEEYSILVKGYFSVVII
jgi:hypothetical protein